MKDIPLKNVFYFFGKVYSFTYLISNHVSINLRLYRNHCIEKYWQSNHTVHSSLVSLVSLLFYLI